MAAPAFPLSNNEVPGEPTVADLANQSGDVSFVIDELVAAGTDETSPVGITVWSPSCSRSQTIGPG